MTTSFKVIVEPEDGVFVTYMPTFDFASTYGPTLEIALERTREMIACYIEAADIEGSAIDLPPADREEAGSAVNLTNFII